MEVARTEVVSFHQALKVTESPLVLGQMMFFGPLCFSGGFLFIAMRNSLNSVLVVDEATGDLGGFLVDVERVSRWLTRSRFSVMEASS